jgi:hypothetical protein
MQEAICALLEQVLLVLLQQDPAHGLSVQATSPRQLQLTSVV